jgi:hypothetical protein
MSFVRVVRFTDVDQERIAGLMARLDEADGPPPGVPSTGVEFLIDEDQGTAIVLQHFDSMDDLRTGEEVLAAMDAGETPGTRVSVDRCELKAKLSV